MKKAPTDQGHGALVGEQLTFLDPPEFSPGLPTRATLADLLLTHLLNGESYTHPEWEELTMSWRLAATVQDLKDLGWPVLSLPVMAPTQRKPDREISRYSFSADTIAKGRELHRPKPLGLRVSDAVAAMMESHPLRNVGDMLRGIGGAHA